MTVTALVLFALVVASGSLFQGLLGFGSALIAAPLALVFVDKGAAVPALGVAGLALNALLLRSIDGGLRRKVLITLLWSSLIGMPAGLVVLTRIPVALLQIVVGGLSVVFAVLVATSASRDGASVRAAPMAGVLSGALATATSMGGPPVVLLMTHAGMTRDQQRKTLAAFFFCSGVISMAVFAAGGLLTEPALVLGAVAVPGAVAGGVLGHRISALVPQRHFRIIALVAVGITGLTAVVSGLLALR